MITEKQIAELQKPFTLAEHGFFQKSPYILKSAIRSRLNRVTPGWLLLPPELIAHDENVVVMRGGIQIGDVKRYAVGTGIVLRATSDGVAFDGAKLAGMISKAYKQATSDILPRAAVEFGIGEYLKDKPKGVNQDNFASWLAKLTADPVDPNAWTAENVTQWVEKWLAKDLTEAQLFKVLNITEKYREFKGTVAEADKAVEAFIELSKFDKPATPIAAAASNAIPLQKIDCPTHLLETGDVVIQEFKSAGSGPVVTRYQVMKNWGVTDGGRIYRLEVKNLVSGKNETVQWTGKESTLYDGPKVKAFAKDPDCCLAARAGGRPMWNRQIAEPVRV